MMTRDNANENEVANVSTGRFRAVPRQDDVATNASLSSDQTNAIRIPRALEQLGAPLHFTEQSRAYLITLPVAGIRQVAQEIRVAIDRGIPVKSVAFDVDIDREEGWDELAAKLNVSLPPEQALKEWEDIEIRLHRARQQLVPGDRTKMEEGFALFVEWETTVDR
jgi:hypothetical protein